MQAGFLQQIFYRNNQQCQAIDTDMNNQPVSLREHYFANESTCKQLVSRHSKCNCTECTKEMSDDW